MEMYQLADELGYITGVAGVCFAITLVVRHSSCILQINRCFIEISRWQIFPKLCIATAMLQQRQQLNFFSDKTLYMQGLAVGFVLLRVEALTEEGKL